MATLREKLSSIADPVGFLANLFSNAPVGFAVWGKDGFAQLTNGAFERVLGVEPPPEYTVLHADLLAEQPELFERAFGGQTVQVGTFWYDPRDPRIASIRKPRRVAINLTLFPLTGADGKIERVAAAYRDDTEMMLANERLKLGEERLRFAQQAARIGTFDWNIQTGVNTWTPELEAMYGLKPGEFGSTQQNWEQLVHPDDRAAAVECVNRGFTTLGPVEGEWRVVWPDGSVHWLVGRFQVFKDETGKPHRLIGINVESTERKTAQLERDRSAARLKVLAESSRHFAAETTDLRALLTTIARTTADLIGDGCSVTLVDTDGESLINVANAHRDRALELDYKTFVGGMRFPISTSPTVAATVVRSGEPKLAKEISPQALVTQVEEVLKPVVARLNVHSFVVVPIRDRQTIIGALSLLRSGPGRGYSEDDMSLLQDLSDRAGLAIASARHHQELERRVAERTAALEAANREMEAFSFSVSHDLRAPLRAIDGFSSALREYWGDKLDGHAKRYLGRITHGAGRMSEIIDSLLSLARVTRTTLREDTVNLTLMARKILERLKAAEPARNVEVMVMDDMVVTADGQLIQGVLENLLGNAWKFSRDKSPARIEFGCEKVEGRTTFYVRDNGAGFDMASANRLFAPFQRLHTADQFEGNGIGLATAQRIVARHGGRLWAQSAVEQGATFRFTLPDPGAQAPSWVPVPE